MTSQNFNYLVFRRQADIERIGFELGTNRPLTKKDKDFLSCALISISRGEDARKVFGVKATRGQRTSFTERNKIVALQFKLSWISAAIEEIDPENVLSGLGYSLEEACNKASEFFPGHEPETLRHEWQTRAEMRALCFNPFLASRPRSS